MARRNNEYRKESNPLLVLLYIAAVLVLVACIAFFVYSSRQEKERYEESVRNAAQYETERQTIREEESESESETETESETEEPEETESEEESEEDFTGETDEDEEESETKAASASRMSYSDEEESETETETETEPYVPEGYPRIYLKQKKVVLQVGDTFNAVDYVKDVTGGSDNYYELFRRIQLDGDYDMNTAGIYQLVYYVVDSAGHSSNRAVLILEVQDPQTEAKEETTEEESEEETKSTDKSSSGSSTSRNSSTKNSTSGTGSTKKSSTD